MVLLVFKCRRCHDGDVVFKWLSDLAVPVPTEAPCSKCGTLHRLGVEEVPG